MHITSVAIENYKSFRDRQVLHFEPGFNLLVGTNNAGKTSVLEVIDLEAILNEPHRSKVTIPQFGGQPVDATSKFDVTLATTVAELQRLLATRDLFLPVTEPHTGNRVADEVLVSRIEAFVADNSRLNLLVSFGSNRESVRIESDGREFGDQPADTRRTGRVVHLSYPTLNAQPSASLVMLGEKVQQTLLPYYRPYRSQIYRFNAKRRPGEACGPTDTHALDREAVTLPYWINHLASNDSPGHRILCGWLNRVFPDVKWVQAPLRNGQLSLNVLLDSPEDRRDDLSVPISRMGSGIGNVLAMLYVVLTSRHPQVIAIDEPNAFLHPRALRELLSILESEGKQHQYILTAHSADVLTAVNTRSISVLDFKGGTTTVKQVGLRDLHAVRGGLADLGIRITELHGRDRVLWVEGDTEELVMPDLLRWACPEVAAGTAVLRVECTGTFVKKGVLPSEVVKIYERLSVSSSALVPPMVCILLDRETKSDAECRRIERESRGKLRFLNRRMLENYLLHPEAVAACLGELGLNVEPSEVDTVLCRALDVADLSGELVEVDGAAALATVFSELSNTAHEFRKTRDVPVIMGFIFENNPFHLEPLRVYLRGVFGL